MTAHARDNPPDWAIDAIDSCAAWFQSALGGPLACLFWVLAACTVVLACAVLLRWAAGKKPGGSEEETIS